jgi:hypothetical protein
MHASHRFWHVISVCQHSRGKLTKLQAYLLFTKARVNIHATTIKHAGSHTLATIMQNCTYHANEPHVPTY